MYKARVLGTLGKFRAMLITNGTNHPTFRKHNPPRGLVNVYYGAGAGYKGGFTAFAGINIRGRDNIRRLFVCGITRNGNNVPYMDG